MVDFLLFFFPNQVNIVLKAGYNRIIDIGVIWDCRVGGNFLIIQGFEKLEYFEWNFVVRWLIVWKFFFIYKKY